LVEVYRLGFNESNEVSICLQAILKPTLAFCMATPAL